MMGGSDMSAHCIALKLAKEYWSKPDIFTCIELHSITLQSFAHSRIIYSTLWVVMITVVSNFILISNIYALEDLILHLGQWTAMKECSAKWNVVECSAKWNVVECSNRLRWFESRKEAQFSEVWEMNGAASMKTLNSSRHHGVLLTLSV